MDQLVDQLVKFWKLKSEKSDVKVVAADDGGIRGAAVTTYRISQHGKRGLTSKLRDTKQ
jgi:hypothetical protein